MKTKLERIREISEKNPKMIFTSLYHHINEQLLKQCHKELDGNKAAGVDRVTKAEYEENLEENLKDLVERLKNRRYRPQPALRVNIEKDNGKLRPLGISAYEDKLVQAALKVILEAVYDPKFQDSMYGYRPNRKAHDALKELNRQVETRKTNYVLDADIKGFFNNIEHEKILELVGYRIKDPNIIWLVRRFLKAGVIVDGKRQPTTRGTEQGNLASPVIANICMNYAIALWYRVKFKQWCRGQSGMVIFADDFVVTFQYENDAKRFLKEVKERLAYLGLELEPTKTRLIEFGRYAEENRRARKEGKPETFNFLGFTHYCSKSRDGERFRMKRKTVRKKLRAKLVELNQWLKQNRGLGAREIIRQLNLKLRGHYGYYGITDNSRSIGTYHYRATKMLFKWFNRRSQKKSYTWEGFKELLKVIPLSQPKICVKVYS